MAKPIFRKLSEDTLAIVASSLTAGILSARGLESDALAAQIAEARSVWIDLFELLRTQQVGEEREAAAVDWD